MNSILMISVMMKHQKNHDYDDGDDDDDNKETTPWS